MNKRIECKEQKDVVADPMQPSRDQKNARLVKRQAGDLAFHERPVVQEYLRTLIH